MTRQTLRYWSKEEVDFLRDNLNKLKICEIGKELKRPTSSVKAKALRLRRGIEHFKEKPVWTEVKQLCTRTPFCTKKPPLAQKTGRLM